MATRRLRCGRTCYNPGVLFAEPYAGLLLVVHAVLAASLVASATHLVVWMRGYPRRRYGRHRAVRRFAIISATLFVTTFVAGNLIYPMYKVRVRVEYLERGTAVVADHRARQDSRHQARERYSETTSGAVADPSASEASDPGPRAGVSHLPRQTAKVARWFDVKEHWVALGMILSLACAVVLNAWSPRRHGAAIADIAFLMAVGAALAAWLGAVVGVVVTGYRSIGGIG